MNSLALIRRRAHPAVTLAGLGTSVVNEARVKAARKVEFQPFRRSDDPERGRCVYLVAATPAGDQPAA